MKRLLTILIFTCLLGQCLLQLGVIGYYELNKNYIAQNLCENRDKPQMKCCGKCYLRKQLKKAGDLEDNQKLPSRTDRFELVVFILPSLFKVNASPALIIQSSVKHPSGQDMRDVAALTAVFHPPGLSC